MYRFKKPTAVLMVVLLLPFLSAFTFGIIAGKQILSQNTGSLILSEPVASMETATSSALKLDAKSAVLIDVGSGQVLFEQDSHQQLPPASVTKVMTMLLAMEAVERGQVALDDQVTISERAASMGGSQMYMEPGEKQTLETLLLGMAVCSANDACVATAEHVSGTEEIFVEHMNSRATELGMEDTHFVNTNGLPVADHYTSAYDIAVMSRELMSFDKPREWFQIWMTDVTVGLDGKKKTELGITNTNKLIKTYPGANGVKTGFTQEAGYCLSASATKGDLTLISVIMGSPTSKIRFAEASRLLDYGFATYDSVIVGKENDKFGEILVEKGAPQRVDAVAGEEISVLIKKGQRQGITSSVELSQKLAAPLLAGAKVGDVVIYQDQVEIARYPLVAGQQSDKAGVLELYIRMLKTLVQ